MEPTPKQTNDNVSPVAHYKGEQTTTYLSSPSNASNGEQRDKLRHQMSHLFHGTQKWGSFTKKSTIKKEKDGEFEETDINSKCKATLEKLNDLCPIFNPHGPLKCSWHLIMIIILIYSLIDIPYTLAFDINLSLKTPKGVIALLVDILLMIDILLTFRTAYFDKYDGLQLEANPKAIAKHYLWTWFVYDFFMSVPFEFMMTSGGDINNNGWTIFLRGIKILRIIHLIKICEDYRNYTFKRELIIAFKLFRILLFMLLYAHVSACIWYFVGCESNKKYGTSIINIFLFFCFLFICIEPHLK